MELSGGKMKIEDFNSGIWEQGFKYKYFVPDFINHQFSWEDDAIIALLEKASLKLGELNSSSGTIGLRLPENVKSGNYVIKIFAEEF